MVNTEWISKPTGITKIIGLVLTIITMALSVHYAMVSSVGNVKVSSYFLQIIPGGYFFLCLGYILSYILDSNYGKTQMQEFVMSACAIPLFITCAGLAFDFFEVIRQLALKRGSSLLTKEFEAVYIAYGVISLVIAVVNAVDSFFNFKNRNRTE